MSCSNPATSIACIAGAAALDIAGAPTAAVAQSQEDPWKFRAQVYL